GMARALDRSGHEILEASDGKAALEVLRTSAPDLTFLDLDMPGLDGRAILRALEGAPRRGEIVVVTADDSIEAAVECMRLGAADYITKPFEVERIRAAAARCARRVELERRVERLENQLDERRSLGALVGASEPMRRLFAQVERAAKAPLDVLIRGETGTGKELIAREIHRSSPRAAGPFVAVNTAAIAESLAESELFGHVHGAFTGAESDRAGVFREAHGGTLFLDEIGDMPLPAQAKILRALQERAVQPVGSSRTVPVDVRVISATHQDLSQAVAEGGFRQDLLYRVRGIEIEVPPLRSRLEDVPLLAGHFLGRLERELGRPAPRLAPAAVRKLLAHAWPGNVRELEQAVRAAAAMASGDEIGPGDIRLEGGAAGGGAGAGAGAEEAEAGFAAFLDLPLTEAKARLAEAFERRAVQRALERHGGNITAAARQLGIHRQSLQQKMAQLGIGRRG
ncbi:MAG: sigma-54-dependent Fis family transcriptional regulator, partial [Planctomycetes bacterium]|nr:sigma-54-dependent Fis family transcriptional regulator [Planctomycetota bacterium]